ncbi:MAG TPA: sigma-70 family RNA polymerase sigma factor [Povalibacter sp.]|uniref:sigma-70 family RNA polymerase sigma factor n=1 Tax=Povalibacter sp. TaxID=1962978 RepID=UPI002C12F9D3|nr:sigma-70 family RNA polymerase sigma factor [Povalibacter sp.]HMN43762.1 sigma-70 family RNA polymerase sigma factor [Povalibacter sp.]
MFLAAAMTETTLRTDAVQSLCREHHSWLQGWLRRRLGCPEQAADLTQDTLLRILASPAAGRPAGGIREPRSYLATIARRVLVDHFRRKSLERAYLEALASTPEPVETSPESRALIVETLCEIDAMLDGLGLKARQAFLLSQLEGLTYAEIAQRLGVSTSSVKKYVARAVEQCLCLALDAE